MVSIINRWLGVLWVFQVLIRPTLPTNTECAPAGSSTASESPFAIFSPLLTTDTSFHERILNEKSRYTSAEYLEIRATVDAAVKADNKDLPCLACVMKRAPAMSNQQEAKMTVRKEIHHVEGRLRQGNSAFSRLGEIQNFLEVGYQQRNQTILIDSKHTQLDSTQEKWIRAQPFSARWMGYDYRQMYWEPWVQSKIQVKYLDTSVAALDHESKSRAMTQQRRLALQQDLKDLSFSLLSKEIETTRDSDLKIVLQAFWKFYYKCKGQEPPARVVLKEWYWQHVARHHVRFQTPSARSYFDVAWKQQDCEVTEHEDS